MPGGNVSGPGGLVNRLSGPPTRRHTGPLGL